MVRPGGLELPTFWFVARRSIQLSYGRAVDNSNISLHLRCDCNLLLDRNFWSTWSSISRNNESDADHFRFLES